MTDYRAACWTSADHADFVLTDPEHAVLSDEELLEEAADEADHLGFDAEDGQITIGTWRE